MYKAACFVFNTDVHTHSVSIQHPIHNAHVTLPS